jgi:hypothetical protein
VYQILCYLGMRAIHLEMRDIAIVMLTLMQPASLGVRNPTTTMTSDEWTSAHENAHNTVS